MVSTLKIVTSSDALFSFIRTGWILFARSAQDIDVLDLTSFRNACDGDILL